MTELLRGPGGAVSVSPAALRQLVVRAAESVGDARVHRPRRGARVELAPGRARVSVGVSARLGASLPDLGREVQQRVAGALLAMCEVAAVVDVTIEDVAP